MCVGVPQVKAAETPCRLTPPRLQLQLAQQQVIIQAILPGDLLGGGLGFWLVRYLPQISHSLKKSYF